MLNTNGAAARGIVIVTGASTGIGRATAIKLARCGYLVYAGVRRQESAAALLDEAGAESRLRPVMLDVTDQQHVAAVAAQVAQEMDGLPLRGVVNNAGIAVAAPLEFLPMDDLRQQFEVNVIGQVAVSQAFLPLLRKHGGRLIYVGSISGLVSTRLLGAYSASKFALEAVADAFRRELSPHGVRVSLVEPGRVATPIWDKSLEDGLARMDSLEPEAREYYGELVNELIDGAKEAATAGVSPEAVARAVKHALEARRARTRYFVGTDAHIVNVLRRVVSDPLLDRLIHLSGR